MIVWVQTHEILILSDNWSVPLSHGLYLSLTESSPAQLGLYQVELEHSATVVKTSECQSMENNHVHFVSVSTQIAIVLLK